MRTPSTTIDHPRYGFAILDGRFAEKDLTRIITGRPLEKCHSHRTPYPSGCRTCLFVLVVDELLELRARVGTGDQLTLTNNQETYAS